MTTEGEERFHRRFQPDETDEVRIYLKGGDDRARSHGGNGPIEVRVVGGPGADTLDDSRGGHSSFYDHEGENRIVTGKGTEESNKPYETPRDRQGNALRDWGSSVLKLPWMSAGGDQGVFVGGGLRFIDYGFRKHPYASRQDVRVGYATGARACARSTTPNFLSTNSRKRTDISLRYSDIDFLRFYGFGNETTREGDDEFYRVYQRQYQFRDGLAPRVRRRRSVPGPRGEVSRHPDTTPAASSPAARPYGVGISDRPDRRPVRGGQPRAGVGQRRIFEVGGHVLPAGVGREERLRRGPRADRRRARRVPRPAARPGPARRRQAGLW